MITDPKELRRIARLPESRRLVADLEKKTEDAKYLHEVLDRNIYRPILERLCITDENGEIIVDSSKLYLSNDDAACTKFYEMSADSIADAGYDVERGYCPALCKDSEVREAARALVDHFSLWFKELTYDTLCCKLDIFNRYIKLICDMVKGRPAS